MQAPVSPGNILYRPAALGQLEKAMAHNCTELFTLNALSRGGQCRTIEGLHWTYEGPAAHAMVCFPELDEFHAAESLDEMMAYYQANTPKGVGCWSLDPPRPGNLDVKLLARGFQTGWRPCWMCLDLQELLREFPKPPGLRILPGASHSMEKILGLPYSGDESAVSATLLQGYPKKATHFLAYLDSRIVGHSCVFYTSGDLGVAGIYDVGVLPGYRNRGIGKAVVAAACEAAVQNGYHYAVLNATGRRMYEKLGFQFIGYGLTWWIVSNEIFEYLPSKFQIRLAESVGNGDIDELNKITNDMSKTEINRKMANGMTLMELAVHCRQADSANWLLAHGSEISVLDAWDLGWNTMAATLLANNPELANNQYGNGQKTLLHIAAERNDPDLARLILLAAPDVTIKDKIYQSTALGWSEYLHAGDVLKLIKEYQDKIRN